MKRKASGLISVAMLISLTGAGVAEAGTLFSTLGFSNDVHGGAGISGAITAAHFSLASPSIITDVRFLSSESPGTYSGSIHWQIYSNDALGPLPPGVPALILAEGETAAVTRTPTGNIPFGPNSPEMQYDFSVGAVALGPGTYWLGLHNGPLSETTEPSSPLIYIWEFGPSRSSDPLNILQYDVAPFDGTWSAFGNVPLFALYGDTVSAVPEPGSLSLFGLGGIALIGYWRRRAARSGRAES